MNALIVIVTFIAMEGVAWATHKYVMHGFLWNLHRDHHTKENLPAWWEKNDAFFLIFATPGALTMMLSSALGMPWLFYIGLGITIYGAAYFMVHDVFIHQRLKWFRKTDNPYFRALRRAHKVHHKHLGKEHGECFGMLMVPFEFFRKEFVKS